jgi:ribosome-associated protein
MISLTKGIRISEDELAFKFTRSGGPGGQNVNKVNTKVTLLFDVANCRAFSDGQKKRILQRLASRADKDGVIRIVSQKYRTQKANRRIVVERLIQLLSQALRTKPVRRKTQAPHWAREQRLAQKKRRSGLKQQRAKSRLVADE